MIDVTYRENLITKLESLKVDNLPVFGKMTSQHMVEHLITAVMFSNGRLPQKLYYPLEKADMIKSSLIYSDKEFPIGFKAPMLGYDLPKLMFQDLPTSKLKLLSELDNFDLYFLNHENSTPINPVLGPLDKHEWIKFHNKHFTHHFKQFNLV